MGRDTECFAANLLVMFSHCRDDFSGYENPFYEEVQDHRSSSGSSHEVFEEEQPPQEEATPRLVEGRQLECGGGCIE